MRGLNIQGFLLLGSSPVYPLELVLPPDLSTLTSSCSPSSPTLSVSQLHDALLKSTGLLSVPLNSPCTHTSFLPLLLSLSSVSLPKKGYILFFFLCTSVSFIKLTAICNNAISSVGFLACYPSLKTGIPGSSCGGSGVKESN